MSKYAAYDSLSASYDDSRSAVCSHWYIGAFLTKLKKPLTELHVLDAGCGTGNYARALLEAGVGQISLFDGSEGMLEKAKQKIGNFIQNGRVVDARHHSLPTLPYESARFDVVMINNVLHHLSPEGDFRAFRESIREAQRVLKPNGMLVMQKSFVHQIANGFWFFYLAPKALEVYKTKYLGVDLTMDILHQAGFADVEIISPSTALLQKEETYFRGSLEEIIASDSFWELVSSDEMAEVKKRYKTMEENGTLRDFIAKHDEPRKVVSQFSLIFARKL